jgi:hypothetical protein
MRSVNQTQPLPRASQKSTCSAKTGRLWRPNKEKERETGGRSRPSHALSLFGGWGTHKATFSYTPLPRNH